MEDLIKTQKNNTDLNNNGIPDKFEYQEANDITDFKPQGNAFDNAYENEEQIKSAIPNYRDYQWYKEPNEGYFFSLGQKVEDLVESNPEKSKEMLKQIAGTSDEISKKDVEPLMKEIEQLTDDNPNNDEVDNQAVQEVTKKVFDKMSLDDIADADEKAMNGEGPILTVEDSIDPDSRYSLEDSLNDFADERFSVNWPQKKETLGDRRFEYTGKEIPEDEKKEEKKLEKFIKSLPNMTMMEDNDSVDINTNQSATSDLASNEISGSGNTEKEKLDGGSKPTVGHSFLGDIGGGGAGAQGGIKVNANIDNDDNDAHSSAGGSKTDVKVEEADANTASMNGANKSEHIDDTLDSLSFKEAKHEKDIKTNEQADLPSGETWTENNDHWELPDIKEMMTKQGGGVYLPFKFTVENGELYVSQIGTGRKLPFDEFLKAEPFAGKQIIELMNGDK